MVCTGGGQANDAVGGHQALEQRLPAVIRASSVDRNSARSTVGLVTTWQTKRRLSSRAWQHGAESALRAGMLSLRRWRTVMQTPCMPVAGSQADSHTPARIKRSRLLRVTRPPAAMLPGAAGQPDSCQLSHAASFMGRLQQPGLPCSKGIPL